MANRFANPDDVFYDASGVIASGGTLQFYASGTTTPLNTYSNQGLTIANLNPIVLDSSGKVPSNVDIFLQNLAYSVVFKDQLSNTVWTKDPVFASDFSTVAQFTSYNGNPNGFVAGSAGSSTIPASSVWDFTNKILYIATQTGNAATTVWTAINASTAAAVVPSPQGYLTPISGTPVIAVDATATSAFFYTPFLGNIVPIYNGSSFTPTVFSELTYSITSSLSANLLYDVFVFNNSGVLTLVTGPAWSVSTAGSGARGTGAGTTQIQRVNGIWVNAVQITGLNGATNYTVPANQGTYLGTIAVDSGAGSISCLVNYGQSRKWGIWNAYNRVPLELKGGDPTSSWTYGTVTWRPSNNSANNSLTTLCGLPEERIYVDFIQVMSMNQAETEIGIGINSVVSPSTYNSTSGANIGVFNIQLYAKESLLPGIGINKFTALESIESFLSGSVPTTFFGTSLAMVLSARWNG